MCTALSLISKQNEIFFGRTMDFYYDFDFDLYFIPRNYLWNSHITPTYNSKYSIIGVGQSKEEFKLADGMNEKGLGIAALYFPGYAYFDSTRDLSKIPISSVEVVTYLLSNCATVKEVINTFSNIQIIGEKDVISNTVAPLHWIVSDKSGMCITIEKTKDGLHILENSIGVLTNSPDFSWHCTNLRNYLNISNKSPIYKNWGNITLTPFGQGSGMIGYPGDFTSPSRFVRISFAKNFIELPNTREETLLSCFHLMNLVSLPKGLVIASNNSVDYTQYTSFMNLNTGDYYFKTYKGNTIKYANIFDSSINRPISLGKLKSDIEINHI